MPAPWLRAAVVLFVTAGGLHPRLAGAEPLHARIDAIIEAKAKADGIPVAGAADDGEFLRRAWLDFAGRVPTPDAARAFLADTSPDKRAKLIDRLLAGPDYPRRMAELFHVHLMERLGDHPEWLKYLEASFRANKPWDRMAREMLRADPKDAANKGASFFLAKRLENYGQNPVDYPALTRDVGRLFLGKNLQCAECHDHLFIDDYKQKDFQGLHAFLRNAYLASGPELLVGERPTTEKLAFASVFTKVEMRTAPAVPGGTMIDLPTFPKGQEFAEPAKGKAPGVPKFSTLAALSERLPAADNRDFARNMANRLWFVLLGRGLVHPLDLHHSGNPPSHPEVLDLLAAEFAGRKFDIKHLLREIARTRAYQRSSVLPATAEPPPAKAFAAALEKRLSAEQLLAAVLAATGEKETPALRAKFVKAFANQPREPEDEVAPSLKAALFLLHDEAVMGLLKPRPGNLADRLAKLDKPEAVAEELYLAVLTRQPTADEAATVAAVLAKHAGKKDAAVGKLIWALVASTEFGVNH